MDITQPDTAEPTDELSAEQLLPIVYDELRRLAASRMVRGGAGMTLQPTALVHEAWIRLANKYDRKWTSREHFFNAAAITMRRILVDKARQKATLKHGGTQANHDPFPHGTNEIPLDERLLLIDESLQRLEQESPEVAQIVMLKYFAGLTNPEIAETLHVNVRTIVRRWTHARIRLFQIYSEIEQSEK